MSQTELPKVKIGFAFELTPELLAKIEECVSVHVNRVLPEMLETCLNEAVEKKVRELIERQEEGEAISLVSIPREEAIKKIKSYIDEYPDCTTSDIIYELGLDPVLVLDVLDELQNKGLIMGVSNE